MYYIFSEYYVPTVEENSILQAFFRDIGNEKA